MPRMAVPAVSYNPRDDLLACVRSICQAAPQRWS